MKTLYFEGAGLWGCAHEYNGINPRIRTAFTNNKGRKIYLELFAGHKNKYQHKMDPGIPDIYIVVDSCHYITDDPKVDDCNCSRIRDKEGDAYERSNRYLEYTLENIRKFINVNLNCDFDKVEVLPEYAGYRVFRNTTLRNFSMYNYGDEFQYDEELTAKITDSVRNLKEKFSKEFNQEYDNTSYWREGDHLRFRINVSDKKMKEKGYTNRDGIVYVH